MLFTNREERKKLVVLVQPKTRELISSSIYCHGSTDASHHVSVFHCPKLATAITQKKKKRKDNTHMYKISVDRTDLVSLTFEPDLPLLVGVNILHCSGMVFITMLL